MATTVPDRKRATAAVPTAASASYHDDPDAVSLHTTRGDYEYDAVPDLPSYTDSVAADGASSNGNGPPPPVDDYQVITQPNKRSWRRQDINDCPGPSNAVGCETSIRMDDRLLDAEVLCDYTQNYLRMLPPRPAVRLQGWHYHTVKKDNKKETHKEYDFDVVLGMQSYFPRNHDPRWSFAYTTENGDKTYRGSFRKTRAPGYKQDIEVGNDVKRELMDWCEDFASNKSALKIFGVSRHILGWDTDLLKDNIVPLIRSTHYRGHIDVTFPVADKNVDIYTPHWVNRARISWVRWIFYLTFLWIFIWPILFFTTKRWNVYNVNWSYSTVTINSQGQPEKKYASISERTWLQKHSNLIQSLVLDKFQGDATDLPVDVQIDSNRLRSGLNVGQTGNRNVDAAVNLIQGSVGAWNALNGRADSGGWGADS